MKHGPLLSAAVLLLFLASTAPLRNGSTLLARDQFDSAKDSFNRQDYFAALRQLHYARLNDPGSAAPWLLAGHCFYLRGQDQAALFHYSQALDLDPGTKNLPPFYSELKERGSVRTPSSFTPGEMASLRRKIGQMIMVSVPGTALSGQKLAMVKAGWVGGVILFNQNVESKTQVTGYIDSLQASSPTPLFVAVDQEGGAVRRFTEQQGFQHLPSLAALGRTKSQDLAYRFGLLSGSQLREVGANLNLAPVVDLDHGVRGSIITDYHRSLGKDPQMVAGLAGEIIRGMRDKNVLATAKHFPTQSIAAENTHEGAAVTDESLAELDKDFLPYKRLIGEGLLDAVMLSHVVYKEIDPYFPASMSAETVRVLLRRKMGYEGLVISDDMRMDAIKGRFPLDLSVVQAVNAGVDILLVTDNMERRVMNTLVEAVASGRVPLRTINEAYQRVMATKGKYGILALAKKQPLPGAPSAKLGTTEKHPSPSPLPQGQREKLNGAPVPIVSKQDPPPVTVVQKP